MVGLNVADVRLEQLNAESIRCEDGCKSDVDLAVCEAIRRKTSCQ